VVVPVPDDAVSAPVLLPVSALVLVGPLLAVLPALLVLLVLPVLLVPALIAPPMRQLPSAASTSLPSRWQQSSASQV
jgi:hypothetical protein